jgi:hypothetical protein
VPHDGTAAHDHVIAMRVKLRPENLNIGDTTPPECAQHIPNEDMLDDALAKSRMCEVTIFRPHDASRYRE